MIRTRAGLVVLTAMLGFAQAPDALAADAASCATVRMSDPGWTDITSTNALLGTVLDALGYTQKVDTLSVPITYQSLKNQQIDAFLGSWQPAQASMLDPLKAAGEVEVLNENLSGIRFTLAVPTAVAEAGVRSVDDLAAHADKFDHKIYGIDPGAAANNNIVKMIQAGGHGLGGWELIESSEHGRCCAGRPRHAARSGSCSWRRAHPLNASFRSPTSPVPRRCSARATVPRTSLRWRARASPPTAPASPSCSGRRASPSPWRTRSWGPSSTRARSQGGGHAAWLQSPSRDRDPLARRRYQARRRRRHRRRAGHPGLLGGCSSRPSSL
ncbi:MAG: glycine betaine ABC transporter substrate-binding protein [Geminicoccaceae bacterium]